MTTNINKAFIEGLLTFGGRGWKLGGGILLGEFSLVGELSNFLGAG